MLQIMSSLQKCEAKVTPYAGLKACCRYIASRESSPDKIQFAVGTSIIGKPNQIQIIEYDDIHESIQCIQALDHEDEVWWISCHPTDVDLMFTISSHASATVSATRLYKIPPQEVQAAFGTPEHQQLELISTFDTGDDKFCQRVMFLPNKDKCLITCEKTLNVFDINRPDKPTNTISVPTGNQITQITASSVDPLHPNMIASCTDSNINLWDIRTQTATHTINDSPQNIIYDISFNENKPWWICTGGSDGFLRCWDVRVCKAKCEFKASSHWVTRAVPSSSHEQWILTAGTDSKVRIINSGEFAFQNDGKLPDGEIIKSIRHDDSVYSATWASNPWVFASVSYKGQVNVCQMPNQVVDAILMGDLSD